MVRLINNKNTMSLINYLSICVLLAGVLAAGCKQSLVISDVDYAQPVESVLTPNEEGIVEDTKNGFSFNIKPLQYSETGDTSSVTVEEVRYIRSRDGFYYITAPGFSSVYVMAPEKGQLKLENRIGITEEGIAEPALNQRGEYIQLVDRSDDQVWALSPDGIRESESSIASNERREEER